MTKHIDNQDSRGHRQDSAFPINSFTIPKTIKNHRPYKPPTRFTTETSTYRSLDPISCPIQVINIPNSSLIPNSSSELALTTKTGPDSTRVDDRKKLEITEREPRPRARIRRQSICFSSERIDCWNGSKLRVAIVVCGQPISELDVFVLCEVISSGGVKSSSESH